MSNNGGTLQVTELSTHAIIEGTISAISDTQNIRVRSFMTFCRSDFRTSGNDPNQQTIQLDMSKMMLKCQLY